MYQAMITHEDGSTTIETIVTEVDSILTDDEKHEFTAWDNGSISIDGLTDEWPSDHVSLSPDAVKQLRAFLLSIK